MEIESEILEQLSLDENMQQVSMLVCIYFWAERDNVKIVSHGSLHI